MKKILTAVLAAAALVGTSAPALAQGAQAPNQQPAQIQLQQQKPQVTASQALGTLHQINRDEIREAQMAVQKSQNPQVKELAQTILQDHQKLDKQVTDLAQKKGISLQVQPTLTSSAMQWAGQQRDQRLSSLQGQRFEEAWLAGVPFEHELALGVVKTAEMAGTIKDPQVNQLLGMARDSIDSHRKMAEGLLQKSMNVAQLSGQGTAG